MIYSGRVPEGLALLDEAMVGISAGEVSPIIAGMVYCSMIEACQELSDFSRAASWTIALTTMVRRAAWPGSVHRAMLAAPRPDHAAARGLRRGACRICPRPAPVPGGGVRLHRPDERSTEQGDVLRIRGKLDEAEAAYRQAAELGHEPQPGLALAWLARGRTAAAISAVRPTAR